MRLSESHLIVLRGLAEGRRVAGFLEETAQLVEWGLARGPRPQRDGQGRVVHAAAFGLTDLGRRALEAGGSG